MRDLLRKYGINSPLDNAAPSGYLNGTSNNGMPNPWNETPQPQTNLYAPAAPQSVLPSNVYSTLLSTTTHQGSIMDILSILGMNIHDEEMTAAEVETASPYDRTYKAFLQTAHGVSPRIPKVELPSREDGFRYAEIYFSMVNPYLPILHKSTFMTLVCNICILPTTNAQLNGTLVVEPIRRPIYSLLRRNSNGSHGICHHDVPVCHPQRHRE